MRHALSLIPVILLLGACDGSVAPPDGGAPPPDAGAMDAASDGGTARPPDVCDALGLPRVVMQSPTGVGFDDVAGDFTVETLTGPWNLAASWTGCESYVFLNYAATSYGNELFSTFPDGLVVQGPRNVHYFFASYERDRAAIRARMEALRDGLEEGYDFYELSAAERAFWRERMHFVTEPLPEVVGSVGELVRTQPIIQHSFGITRDQRFDPVGSLFQLTRTGFRADLGMGAYAGHYYNYLARLRARLAAERDVTVVTVMDERDVTARTLDRTATLPAAATMAGFDTLEVDLEIHCRRANPQECSEWDRNAYVLVCLDEGCTETRELVRWITPYARPGLTRWVIDASPMLGLLRAGGSQRFRVITGPDWEAPTPSDVRVALRLSQRGEPSARESVLAFTGGEFDARYNEGREPFAFTPPADATRVELVVIVSGHGQTERDNCAEWCNHEHTFTLNGAATRHIAFPGEAGQSLGCAQRAAEGVVPGQWGNWAPSRAAWCPGFPVDARRFDISADVRLGVPNELSYRGSFQGGDPRGGTIDLSAYVVYY